MQCVPVKASDCYIPIMQLLKFAEFKRIFGGRQNFNSTFTEVSLQNKRIFLSTRKYMCFGMESGSPGKLDKSMQQLLIGPMQCVGTSLSLLWQVEPHSKATSFPGLCCYEFWFDGCCIASNTALSTYPPLSDEIFREAGMPSQLLLLFISSCFQFVPLPVTLHWCSPDVRNLPSRRALLVGRSPAGRRKGRSRRIFLGFFVFFCFFLFFFGFFSFMKQHSSNIKQY